MDDGTREIGTAVVTGASGFTGRYVTRRLLGRGVTVRSLTNHPERESPFDAPVGTHPYTFGEPGRLAEFLEGADVLFNTYWIRFEHGDSTFEGAVENSRTLFRAARRAGVGRVVHVSVTNPDPASSLPYFRGKAEVEEALRATGLSHAVLRPALVFGLEDILLNNIAWLFRRFPVFLVPGKGDYRVQPIHVDDLARAAVETAGGREDRTLDVVGPEAFTFEEALRRLRDALDGRVALLHAPPWACLLAARALGLLVRDVMLTRHEVEGLTAGLLSVEDGSTADGRWVGDVAFTAWIREHADRLGAAYHSELERHFR